MQQLRSVRAVRSGGVSVPSASAVSRASSAASRTARARAEIRPPKAKCSEVFPSLLHTFGTLALWMVSMIVAS